MTNTVMVDRVRSALELNLLKPQYRKQQEAGAHPMTGHCYVASEALYHLLGGSSSGYTPTSLRVGDSVHWWLTGPQGEVLDPTADQFIEPVQYDQGRGRGFLTKQPSRRAAVVIQRVTPPKMRSDSLSAVVLTYFASDPKETCTTIAEDIAGMTHIQVLGTITSLKRRGLLIRQIGSSHHSPTPLGWAAIKRMKRKPK